MSAIGRDKHKMLQYLPIVLCSDALNLPPKCSELNPKMLRDLPIVFT